MERCRNCSGYEEAIADYNKAIRLNPDYALAYNNRGLVYRKLGKYKKALKDYTKAIEIDPYYAEAYAKRGAVYQFTGQVEKALKEFNKAIEIMPYFAGMYYNRGVAYEQLSKYKQAIKDFTRMRLMHIITEDRFMIRRRNTRKQPQILPRQLNLTLMIYTYTTGGESPLG